jgi:sec-independent protein translocase protein TatA
MFGSLGAPEILVIAVVALIVFGPSKLPEFGKSLGEAIKGFKKAINESENKPVDRTDVAERPENGEKV